MILPYRCTNFSCRRVWNLVYAEERCHCPECGRLWDVAEIIHLVVPALTNASYDFRGSRMFHKEHMKFLFLCEEARQAYRNRRDFTVTVLPEAATCYNCLVAYGVKFCCEEQGEVAQWQRHFS